ncbi:MAG: transcriptional regulator [Methanohalobium sp.]|uniref:transcriptional regulator n=1 Tax=Methanohalobium sp. TaxID=2837493 RepID=UPI0039796415
MKMNTPCQVIVWDVLPAIRAALASELVKNGVSQRKVAELFDMAPSAVSQYITKKRGYRIEFDEDIKTSIANLASEIQQEKVDDVSDKICEICKKLRSNDGNCPTNF